MTFRYLSVCSGIEAASVAWHDFGWEAAAFSEIDDFPRAVLAHHYPAVPLHGDFTTIGENDYGAIDLLVGGTPCQAFSVAGLRKGFADSRGNLTLEFIRLAQRKKPRWILWENVPGVLSIDGGRAFGSFLGGLAECGYGFAYRVLDAQYFGVPQRRRRVFVVGYLGDWRPPAAVLFERESLCGHTAPIREEGEGFTCSPEGIAGTCSSKWAKGTGGPAGDEHYNLVVYALQGNMIGRNEGAGPQGCGYDNSGACFTLTKTDIHAVASNEIARRLTPLECERLQGLPDNYTQISYNGKPAPDGLRYKAIGNSMASPVMRWLGQRINKIEEMVNVNQRR